MSVEERDGRCAPTGQSTESTLARLWRERWRVGAVVCLSLWFLREGTVGQGQAGTNSLAVSLSGPASTTVNVQFSYTITVSSPAGTGTSATVTDILPPGVSFVSSDLGAACAANLSPSDLTTTVVCTNVSVGTTFHITALPTSSAGGTITNVVGVIGAEYDNMMSDNASSVVVNVTGGSSGGGTTSAGFFWTDFDGDGYADKAVYRPGGNSTWYVKRSDGGSDYVTSFGTTGDIPVPGRYTGTVHLGNIQADYAVFRPSTGYWYVRTVPGVNQPGVQWGASGDTPVPGQYGGDARTDYAVWRPSDQKWYVKTVEGTLLPPVQWGAIGDIPVPGDYDGDGITDMAVFRPSNGTWYVRQSGGGTATVAWGAAGDIAVSAAFTNTLSRADYGIFRPSNATWYVKSSVTPFTEQPPVVFGTSGDAPLPAKMAGAGDARADKVLWRSSNGTWYVRSAEGVDQLPSVVWGISSDIPMAR